MKCGCRQSLLLLETLYQWLEPFCNAHERFISILPYRNRLGIFWQSLNFRYCKFSMLPIAWPKDNRDNHALTGHMSLYCSLHFIAVAEV